MFLFIQCQCFDQRRGVYFLEKVSVFIKIGVLFWPEISAIGVFFNFEKNELMRPSVPECPPGENFQTGKKVRAPKYLIATSLMINSSSIFSTLIFSLTILLMEKKYQKSNWLLHMSFALVLVILHKLWSFSKIHIFVRNFIMLRVFSRVGYLRYRILHKVQSCSW